MFFLSCIFVIWEDTASQICLLSFIAMKWDVVAECPFCYAFYRFPLEEHLSVLPLLRSSFLLSFRFFFACHEYFDEVLIIHIIFSISPSLPEPHSTILRLLIVLVFMRFPCRLWSYLITSLHTSKCILGSLLMLNKFESVKHGVFGKFYTALLLLFHFISWIK